MAGVYAYSGREDWQYRGIEDGGTLTLMLERGGVGDGGAIAVHDAGAGSPASVEIVMTRSSSGFAGAIAQTVYPAPGAACVVAFPTEVVACDDAGITLSSAESVDVDQACGSPPDAGSVRKMHRLERVGDSSDQ